MNKLYSIENFISSVKSSYKYKDVSNITLAGFKARMIAEDKYYVSDAQEYVKALDDYLN